MHHGLSTGLSYSELQRYGIFKRERILKVIVENFQLPKVHKPQSQYLSSEIIKAMKAWDNISQLMEADYGKSGWPHKAKLFF